MNWINRISYNAKKVARLKGKQQQFLWLIATVLLVMAGVKMYNALPFFSIALVGFLISIISFIRPNVSYPILYIWMIIGAILSEVSSSIVLVIVFFFVIFPIRVIKGVQKNEEGWIDSEVSNFDDQF